MQSRLVITEPEDDEEEQRDITGGTEEHGWNRERWRRPFRGVVVDGGESSC